MKKLLALALVLSFCAATVRAEPTRSDYVTRVETCEAVLQEMQFHPETAVPAAILSKAKALVIVHEFKAGLIIGVKGGYAVALARQPDGSWSVPALMNTGGASLGLQLGAQGVDTIFVLMDDASVNMLFRSRVNFGVDAKAVAGPRASEVEKTTTLLRHSVLVYTTVNGLYAGATVKTSYLNPNDDANHLLYNTSYNLPELLFGHGVVPPPEVRPLMNYVKDIAR